MPYSPASPFNKLPDLPAGKGHRKQGYIKEGDLGPPGACQTQCSFQITSLPTHLINSLILPELESSSFLAEIKFERKEVFTASSSEDPATYSKARTIFNLQKALWSGYHTVKEKGRIDMALAGNISATITGTANPIRQEPIQFLNPSTGDPVYSPPAGEKLIFQKLKNLEAYMNSGSDQVEVLVRMAVVHYQFSSICPYQSANGRTGRILSILFLTMNDLLDLPVLYLSQYIKQNREAYYAAMNKVRSENKWKPWIYFMIDAVEKAAG